MENNKQKQEDTISDMENNGINKVAMRVKSLPEAFHVVNKRPEDLGLTKEDLESEMSLNIETE